MKLLVDGVGFRTAGTDAARLWQSILPALAAQHDLDVMILDRGGVPPLEGVTRIPFPAYKSLYTADDSALIERICDFYAVDVFTSTADTSPLTTPMVLLVLDDVEPTDANPVSRSDQERAIAIAYARRHLCLSQHGHDVLKAAYPTLDRVDIVQPGIDHARFRPADADVIAAFRKRIGFGTRPYLIATAHRGGSGDDNATVLLDTIATFGIEAFDVLWIGDEGAIDRRKTAVLPIAVNVARIDANDADLTVALSGAAAVIHPVQRGPTSLIVGEAMACGCPVVTTLHDPQSPILGSTGLILEPFSQAALADALARLRSADVRETLRRDGLAQARSFDRATLVDAVAQAARETVAFGENPAYRTFADTWRVLRQMQAAVDTDTWTPSS